MKILVTGGAGYIGSHTIIELIEAGHSVVSLDNFSNSSSKSLERVGLIAGQEITNYDVDLTDKQALDSALAEIKPEAVIHFAGLKAVGESVEQPLKYYANNIVGTINLLRVMQANSCFKLIFSSSATVYGTPKACPIDESAPARQATNPYGQTKAMIEQILEDLSLADKNWQVSLLRYFNPIGAHSSGQIGEDPSGTPNNIAPYITQVAVGKLMQLTIFGNDYDTIDGTGVRDYIHVVDLAKGHLAALEHLKPGCQAYNLGTGRGVSVLELVKAFEEASGKKIDYNFGPRRAGDIATCFANADKAKVGLGWQTQFSLLDACRDAWRWQVQNPDGYN